jgi:dolichol-phosphate mannosyltransferase
MALALDWIVAFSWLPLRFSVMLGLIIAAVGAIYATFIVANAILGHPVEGWSSVMTTVLLLSGIQLVMLGAIGEYVGRGLDESRKRPIAFVEREVHNDEHA